VNSVKAHAILTPPALLPLLPLLLLLPPLLLLLLLPPLLLLLPGD
jgi:hypothetical protein